MTHYIEIVGPHDNTVYGPFATRADADKYNERLHDKLDPNVFDTYVYDQTRLDEKFAEFGPIEVERPKVYGIMCNVSGGVTGTRSAWLKSNGQVVTFITLDDANARARELEHKLNSNPYRTADFSYRAMEMS